MAEEAISLPVGVVIQLLREGGGERVVLEVEETTFAFRVDEARRVGHALVAAAERVEHTAPLIDAATSEDHDPASCAKACCTTPIRVEIVR